MGIERPEPILDAYSWLRACIYERINIAGLALTAHPQLTGAFAQLACTGRSQLLLSAFRRTQTGSSSAQFFQLSLIRLVAGWDSNPLTRLAHQWVIILTEIYLA